MQIKMVPIQLYKPQIMLKHTKDGLADNIYFKTCFNSLATVHTYSSYY